MRTAADTPICESVRAANSLVTDGTDALADALADSDDEEGGVDDEEDDEEDEDDEDNDAAAVVVASCPIASSSWSWAS